MKSKNKKIISRFTTSFVIILLLTASLSFFASADNNVISNKITKKYSFDMPLISQVKIKDNVYDRITISNSPGTGNPGEPRLPAYGVHLLLPPAIKVTDIEVTPSERIFLGSGFNVEPVGEPAKLSNIDSFSNPFQSEFIYRSNNSFPGSLFSNVGIYKFRGYEILVLMLHPIQYIPNSGELYYFKDMTISIKTVDKDQVNPLFRNMEKDKIELKKKVDNFLSIISYADTVKELLFSDEYDLLILTTNELKDNFEPLKDAHDANGITTKIKTLNDISRFPNSVTPADIRNFIKNEYINSGIEYVLIGGDEDIIPTRYLWVQAFYGGDSVNMPSDLYYACLDGTYNYNNDDKWGEPTDGDDGNDVDLVAEVYIGRACVGNKTEVDNFVSKTITYMDYGGYSSGTSLMIGEKLWSVPETWGGDYMDEIINGSSASGYTTTGISTNQYAVDTLYDRDWPDDNNWPTSEIINKLDNGVLIVNHMGHSFYGISMKMDNSDVSSLTNDNPCFVYSQGCNAGGFDSDDCIAEYFTVKTRNAAFSVIMNAREGWASLGSTGGPSQRFHREFWDAIFGENITEIGKANQDSKEDILYQINNPCMRWCYYQLNLFGDPTLTFYNNENNPPTKPTKPFGIKIGKIGEEYILKTTSTDKDGDMIYYRWDFGDGTFSDWLGPFTSDEEASVSHSWSKLGKFKIKVKARDEHRTESEWSYQSVVRMPIYANNLLLDIIIKILEKYFPII